jgi:hypothetical protein
MSIEAAASLYDHIWVQGLNFNLSTPAFNELKSTISETRTVKGELIMKLIAIFSGASIAGLTIYSIIASYIFGITVVGETLVNLPDATPFEFPAPEYFPLYAKPVSWLFVFVVLFGFSSLELAKPRIRRVSPTLMNLYRTLAFTIVGLSAYEILYNFSIWSALMSYQAITGSLNPDTVIVAFPNPQTPWNLVFATKVFSASFIVSLYALYTLLKAPTPVKSTWSQP